MPEVQPHILQKPLLEITLPGATPTTVEIQCSSNQVEIAPEQDETTTETFCGSYTSYKAEVWTVTITALQSFGADGLWTQLRPMAGKFVDFRILPDADLPVGVDNPEMTGSAILKAFAFLSASVGEPSDFDVVLGVQGMPTWSTTPAAGMEAAAAPEPESVPA